LKKILRSSKGFSLVEVIIVIIVLGVCLTPFSILLVNVMQQNVRSQQWATEVALAESKLEQACSMRFSEIIEEPVTGFEAPFSMFGYQLNVSYVDASNLDVPVAGPTDYKRVEVAVFSAFDMQNPIKLVTLVTNDW